MKLIYPFLTFALLATVLSCTETEETPEIDPPDETLIETPEETFEVSVPEANFEITFPVSKAEKTVATQIIDGEEVAVSHYSANMHDKGDLNKVYQIDYIFLPEIDTEEEINDLYDEQRNHIILTTISKLEYESIVELKGVVGRQFRMTVEGLDLTINGEMYFKNGIFYKTIVVTDSAHLNNKKISSFLASLKILD